MQYKSKAGTTKTKCRSLAKFKNSPLEFYFSTCATILKNAARATTGLSQISTFHQCTPAFFTTLLVLLLLLLLLLREGQQPTEGGVVGHPQNSSYGNGQRESRFGL